jgi:hypothetical protein
MKKAFYLFFLVLCNGLISCNFSSSSNQNETQKVEKKEIPIALNSIEIGKKLDLLNKIYSFNLVTLYTTDTLFSPPKEIEYNPKVVYVKITNKELKLLDSDMQTIDIFKIKGKFGSLLSDNTCSFDLLGEVRKYKDIKIWIINGNNSNEISWMTISYRQRSVKYKWMLNN